MFFEAKISDDVLQKLDWALALETSAGNFVEPNSSCTKNGLQTNTIHENSRYKTLLDDLLISLPNEFHSYKYRWFHLIDYKRGGWQEQHDHSRTEDFSFIVYLTTCASGGKTFFHISDSTTLVCSPVRGTMIAFPATVTHWGEEVVDPKQVAVGALIR